MTENLESLQASLTKAYTKAKKLRPFTRLGEEYLPDGVDCIENDNGTIRVFLEDEYKIDLGSVKKAADKFGFFGFNLQDRLFVLPDSDVDHYSVGNNFYKLSKGCLVYTHGLREILFESKGRMAKELNDAGVKILGEYLKLSGERKIA